MIEPRKLADFLKPPNWAVTGTTIALVLLLVSGVFAFSSAENSAQAIQMVYQSALVIAGLIGLPLAIWRSWTAHTQAITGQRQLEGFQRQVALLEAGAEADRLQKGTELLESDKLVVRIAGVAILRSIAMKPQHSFHTEAFRVLDAFARSISDAQTRWDYEVPSERQVRHSPDDLIEAFNALLDSQASPGKVIGTMSIRGNRINNTHFRPDIASLLELISCNLRDCVVETDTFFQFVDCSFDKCTINIAKLDLTDYNGCRFSDCRFIGSCGDSFTKSNKFYNSDLSELDADSRVLFPKINRRGAAAYDF